MHIFSEPATHTSFVSIAGKEVVLVIKNTIEAPLWPSVDTIPAQYPWLSADETCEVAVLGGGVTAAMCALRFAEAGIDTVLVSASPVGFGGSACSSGMMTLASGNSLVSLVEEIGAERAMSAAELLLGSLKNLEDFCASTEDGCGFRRKDSLLYTSEEACTAKLRREYSLRLHNGLDVELLNADTASEQFTFPMEAGVYTKNAAAQVDPYRLTHAAVRAAKEKGARIYENTTASAINQSAQDDITLECSTHHRIQARYVIVAAGLETHRYCGGLTQAGTTYLLATEPVEEFAGWRGTCLIHREGDARQYITVTPDHRILIGGLDSSVLDEKGRVARLINLQNLAEKRHHALAYTLRDMFPAIRNITAEYVWAAKDGRTSDGLPVIGRLPANSRVAYAMCCGDNGILYAEAAGRLLLDQYQGVDNQQLGLFSPNREWRIKR